MSAVAAEAGAAQVFPGEGRELITVAGREVEVVRRGTGKPILLLHGIHEISPTAPFLDLLAASGEVIAPTHPGFGRTPREPDFATVYDLVHHYRALIEEIGDRVTLVGFSFGGWLAAELAAARVDLGRLVLVAPFGVKLGGREERDIVHIFNTAPTEMRDRGWSAPEARLGGALGAGWQLVLDELSDEEVWRAYNSNEALSVYGWRPHMFNPQLGSWLPRISVPTLVLWGADDRIALPAYGRRYASVIPGAKFDVIPDAGHHPELEQPRAFADRVAAFVDAR